MKKEFIANPQLAGRIKWEVFKNLAVVWLFRLTLAYLFSIIGAMVLGFFVPFASHLLFVELNHDIRLRWEAVIPVFVLCCLFTLLVVNHRAADVKIQEKKLGDWIDLSYELTFKTSLVAASNPKLEYAAEQYRSDLEKDREFLKDALSYLKRCQGKE